MDIGFEGGLTCLKRSINSDLHPTWIAEDNGKTVKVAETGFHTVFANDIRPDAKAAWVSYFSRTIENAMEECFHRREEVLLNIWLCELSRSLWWKL